MKLPPATPVTLVAQGDTPLEGRLAMPANAVALVLFAPGDTDWLGPANLQVAEALQAACIATLLLDIPARTDAGVTPRTDTALLARALIEAGRWVAGRADLQALPLGYYGSSAGADAALIAAARGGPMRALVASGARPDLADESLDRLECPTLLIVGSSDRKAIGVNRRAFARLRGERELVLVPNAHHGFEELGAMETVTQYAVEWFTRYLAVRTHAGV